MDQTRNHATSLSSLIYCEKKLLVSHSAALNQTHNHDLSPLIYREIWHRTWLHFFNSTQTAVVALIYLCIYIYILGKYIFIHIQLNYNVCRYFIFCSYIHTYKCTYIHHYKMTIALYIYLNKYIYILYIYLFIYIILQSF